MSVLWRCAAVSATAIWATSAGAQSGEVIVSDGASTTAYGAAGATGSGIPLIPQILLRTANGPGYQTSLSLLPNLGLIAESNDPSQNARARFSVSALGDASTDPGISLSHTFGSGANASGMAADGQEARLYLTNFDGVTSGTRATLDGTFTGISNPGAGGEWVPFAGISSSNSFGSALNQLYGFTRAQDLAVNGRLDVTGLAATNGIANTGNITTDTLTVNGAATFNGPLNTNGLTNTGSFSTTTLTTTGNATVGGNLTVQGVASTNGIDNNGQVIRNVAPGVAPTDAVNVQQMNAMSGNQAAALARQDSINATQANVNSQQAFTNTRVQQQLTDNRKVASTGAAVAVAAASIPALEAGKSVGVGAGVGHYDGQAAFAVGVAARVNESLQIKLNVGTGPGGRAAVGAGGMWSW